MKVSDCTPFVIFVDSSRYSFGSILCQIQPMSENEILNEKLSKSLHRIYLIEYFSRAIPDNSLLCPIAILELESLYLCLKHWRHFVLGGFRVIIMTDSRFVSYWLSIDLCSEKIARIIDFISQFNLEINFLPSELNQSDLISQMHKQNTTRVPNLTSPFDRMVIRNSDGIVLDKKDFFSEDMRKRLNEWFRDKKRGG